MMVKITVSWLVQNIHFRFNVKIDFHGYRPVIMLLVLNEDQCLKNVRNCTIQCPYNCHGLATVTRCCVTNSAYNEVLLVLCQ